MPSLEEQKYFYSKILLFGEYSVIQHSMGLCIPYDLFSGRLTFRKDNQSIIDPELKAFSLFVKNLIEAQKLIFSFDITSFEFDISQGLFFESTIPQGYGVGSSGALVAAIFDRYHQEDPTEFNIARLKKIFAQLESHFHGASSGVDPLISYLNSPILIKNKADLGICDIPKMEKSKGAIFLINTKRSRKTEPLVNLFLEKVKNEEFSHLCFNELGPVTNDCIEHFLNGNVSDLFTSFKALSQFQAEHLSPMIPNLYKDLWQKGIETEDYYLKLCGAGGGGFLMGISKDFHKAKKALSSHELRVLFEI